MPNIKKIQEGLKKEFRWKIYFTIVEQPASFSDLLQKKIVSRAALARHLRQLEIDGLIYKEGIRPTETSNPSEIGRVVYRAVPDEQKSKDEVKKDLFALVTQIFSPAVVPSTSPSSLPQELIDKFVDDMAKVILPRGKKRKHPKNARIKEQLGDRNES